VDSSAARAADGEADQQRAGGAEQQAREGSGTAFTGPSSPMALTLLVLLPSSPQVAAIEKKQVSRTPMMSFLMGRVLRP
jgi:hypothetical protein